MTQLDSNDADLLRDHQDNMIEQEIKRKLAAVITWDTTDIRAKVQNETVFLAGTVADTKALEQSVLVVFTVRGVRQIDNKIRIRKDGITSVIPQATPGMTSSTNDQGADN